VGPGSLGLTGNTPVRNTLLPCPSLPRGGGGGAAAPGLCPLPRIFFYFVFKVVYFGVFWTDLLTMRDTCDTITNIAAVAF